MVIIVVYKSEGRIQSEILLAVSKRGHKLFRSNAGKVQTKDGRWMKLMPAGYTDLTGHRAWDGKVIYIEVKTPTGKLRPDQIKFRDAMLKHPVIYGVARSSREAIDIIENNAEYHE